MKENAEIQQLHTQLENVQAQIELRDILIDAIRNKLRELDQTESPAKAKSLARDRMEKDDIVNTLFEHPLFRKAPALAALGHTASPNPMYLRACLLELVSYITETPLFMFDHPLFRKSPALAELKTVGAPSPEHVRACLLELVLYITKEPDDRIRMGG